MEKTETSGTKTDDKNKENEKPSEEKPADNPGIDPNVDKPPNTTVIPDPNSPGHNVTVVVPPMKNDPKELCKKEDKDCLAK